MFKSTTNTTTGSANCPVADPRDGTGTTYRAFCMYNAYGGGTVGGTTYGKCVPSPTKKCIGRVACRDALGQVVKCSDDIAKWEGMDCFSNSASGNYKICGCNDPSIQPPRGALNNLFKPCDCG